MPSGTPRLPTAYKKGRKVESGALEIIHVARLKKYYSPASSVIRAAAAENPGGMSNAVSIHIVSTRQISDPDRVTWYAADGSVLRVVK